MPNVEITEQTSGGWSLYDGRIFAPVPVRAVITPTADDYDPLPYVVEMTLDVRDGRVVCTELKVTPTAEGPAIATDELRRVAVGKHIALIVEKAFPQVGIDLPPADFVKTGPNEDTLEGVARVYAFCMATGQKPTGMLVNEYGIPSQTASRWIAAAKRKKIIVEKHEMIPDEQ